MELKEIIDKITNENKSETTFIIKSKSAIGQQIERAYLIGEGWRVQKSFSDGEFTCTKSTANELLAYLKLDARNAKWVRLYDVI